MQINVIGNKNLWPGKPGLLEAESVYFYDLPHFGLNPIWVFKFFRQIKKCMIIYWIEDDSTAKGLGAFPGILSFIRMIIKKPNGPAIVIKPKAENSKLAPIADVLDQGQDRKTLFKEAYFVAQCGHPVQIYNEPIQKERIQWLRKNREGKVLEIGCSTGFVLNYVGGGIGVDLDELRLEYAKKTYPHCTFISADAAKMPFSDHELDTVMIPDILEHVPREHAQKIINESMRIGKRLLVTVPNAGKPNYRKDLVENPEHLWFPTEKIMYEMLGPKAQISLSPGQDFIYGVVSQF